MYKYILAVSIFYCIACSANAQPKNYTVSNAHSHNDYVHPDLFYAAYSEGFGSIESDIFLYQDQLIIGHDTADLKAGLTLEKYYLLPLDSCARSNGGKQVYQKKKKQLILLIDIKTSPKETLNKLVSILEKFPLLISNPTLRFVITGNRPSPELYTSYPKYIWFDGILSDHYESEALSRIVMMSDNFRKYASWDGKTDISASDKEKLLTSIQSSHALRKPVRFWNAPDTILAWKQFMQLGADYINTDHIRELAAFLKQ